MRYMSLFSGIEAATVAWHPLGWEPVAFAEIEPFPCAVLAHHYPEVPNLGSVTGITTEQIAALGRIDVVVGGSPCQDLSVAGKRSGLAGERSGLFHEQVRIFNAARLFCGARWLVWENVPGAFSSNQGRDFAVVAGSMAGCDLDVPEDGWGTEGVALGENGLVEWCVLDAQWFGVAQRRRRVFAVLDVGNWSDRPPVLLERDGLRGDSAPRRFPTQETPSPSTTGTVSGGERLKHLKLNSPCGSLQELSDVIVFQTRGTNLFVGNISGTLGTNSMSASGSAPCVVVHGTQDPCVDNEVSFALGRNNGQENVVAVAVPHVDVMPTLRAGAAHDSLGRGARSGAKDDYIVPVAYGIPGNWIGRKPENGGNSTSPHLEVSPCLTATDVHGVAAPIAYAFDSLSSNSMKSSNPVSGCNVVDVAKTLDTTRPDPSKNQGGNAILHPESNYVRRLTPRECERLQGFPDDYTLIPVRGKPAADGPRYKALGNSMAVPVMRWIGKRIAAVDQHLEKSA